MSWIWRSSLSISH